MLIVSDDYLISICKENSQPSSKTHLFLTKRDIIGIDYLHQFCQLQVVDLRYNVIFSIVNFSNQSFLTTLYLQNNEIRRMDGFNFLVSLCVLFLDYNKVEIVENLNRCPLRTLSVKGQILPTGQTIAFEPICMKCLSPTLEIIDVCKNRLLSIKPLSRLVKLRNLEASDNDFNDLEEFLVTVSAFQKLETLNLIRTPIAEDSAHVKEVVTACIRLTNLNGRNITGRMRIWCENMTRNRRKRREDKENNLQEFYDASVSSLPTSLRPVLTDDFMTKVYDRISGNN